jgi:hypothetical protein
MKKINWIKLASAAGMVIGFIGTIISNYASEKQTESYIQEAVAKKVEEVLGKGE